MSPTVRRGYSESLHKSIDFARMSTGPWVVRGSDEWPIVHAETPSYANTRTGGGTLFGDLRTNVKKESSQAWAWYYDDLEIATNQVIAIPGVAKMPTVNTGSYTGNVSKKTHPTPGACMNGVMRFPMLSTDQSDTTSTETWDPVVPDTFEYLPPEAAVARHARGVASFPLLVADQTIVQGTRGSIESICRGTESRPQAHAATSVGTTRGVGDLPLTNTLAMRFSGYEWKLCAEIAVSAYAVPHIPVTIPSTTPATAYDAVKLVCQRVAVLSWYAAFTQYIQQVQASVNVSDAIKAAQSAGEKLIGDFSATINMSNSVFTPQVRCTAVPGVVAHMKPGFQTTDVKRDMTSNTIAMKAGEPLQPSNTSDGWINQEVGHGCVALATSWTGATYEGVCSYDHGSMGSVPPIPSASHMRTVIATTMVVEAATVSLAVFGDATFLDVVVTDALTGRAYAMSSTYARNNVLGYYACSSMETILSGVPYTVEPCMFVRPLLSSKTSAASAAPKPTLVDKFDTNRALDSTFGLFAGTLTVGSDILDMISSIIGEKTTVATKWTIAIHASGGNLPRLGVTKEDDAPPASDNDAITGAHYRICEVGDDGSCVPDGSSYRLRMNDNIPRWCRSSGGTEAEQCSLTPTSSFLPTPAALIGAKFAEGDELTLAVSGKQAPNAVSPGVSFATQRGAPMPLTLVTLHGGGDENASALVSLAPRFDASLFYQGSVAVTELIAGMSPNVDYMRAYTDRAAVVMTMPSVYGALTDQTNGPLWTGVLHMGNAQTFACDASTQLCGPTNQPGGYSSMSECIQQSTCKLAVGRISGGDARPSDTTGAGNPPSNSSASPKHHPSSNSHGFVWSLLPTLLIIALGISLYFFSRPSPPARLAVTDGHPTSRKRRAV